jgi:hypothetical protein
MIRTYRSSKIWLWFILWLPLGCAICGVFIVAGTALLIAALTGDGGDTPRWFDVSFAIFFFSLGSVGGTAWVYGALDMCYEFWLSDDGTCEFRSLLRRKRVRAQQIVSLELDEGTTNVRYQGGKLHLLETDDFADFVARLKELNPGVVIDGPERWAPV